MAKMFKNLTLQEQYKAYFADIYGAKSIPSKNKYEMMEYRGKGDEMRYLFLGKAGAVRFNNKKAVEGSFSMTTPTLKSDMLKWAVKKGLIKE